MFLIKIVIILLFLPIISYSQTDNTFPVETENTTTEQILPPNLPELGELKIKMLTKKLEDEELFRLASFYLSYQLYHQAAEIYKLYIEKIDNKSELDKRKAMAYYNRALSLFSLKLYDSALRNFSSAYYYDNIIEALRMSGTIYFIKKNKQKSLEYWNQYLKENTTPSPNRTAIEQAIVYLSQLDFEFEDEKEKDTKNTNNSSWPFLNPEIIPNPDSQYEKKRII